MESLSARRLLRRAEYLGKEVRQIGDKCVKRPKTSIRWEYDGHSGEADTVKKKKKECDGRRPSCRFAATRVASKQEVKYVRGLQVFQDGANMKFVDRDLCGSVNIGLLWLCDNIEGRSRPAVFVRPKKDS